MHEELVLVATPTKAANYLGGIRTGPIINGRIQEAEAYPGANIRVIQVPEQDLPDNLSDVVIPPDAPTLRLN